MNSQNSDSSTFYELSIFSDIIQNLWWLIVIIFFFITFWVYIAQFTKRINKECERQIYFFKKDGKYIPELFVELNNTKELIRYFIFSNKWKKRIIKRFNLLYSNSYGDILKKANNDDNIKYKLHSWTKKTTIINTINKHLDMFVNFDENRKLLFKEEYGESLRLISISSRTYKDELNDLKEFYNAIDNDFLFLVGSAGNGKTNLLCNVAQHITNMKNPCIFINSKDVQKTAIDEFLRKLIVPQAFENYRLLLFKITVFLLRARGKKLFVLIDAINENDFIEFKNSIAELINVLLSINGIKLIASCRTEYFEERYKNLFENKLTSEPFIYNIKGTHYTERALDRLHEVYSNHFNYSGVLSLYVRKQLSNSLILMRLFYETHIDSHENAITLNKYQIYKKYIDKIKNENLFDVEILLNKISTLMINTFNFESFVADDLHFSDLEVTYLKQIADENILISRTLEENKGTIAAKEKEIWYFVFDELRDFCISRTIISKCMEDNDYNRLYEFMGHLYLEQLSPLEGVVKYSYKHFKDLHMYTDCQTILDNYSSNQITKWKNCNRGFNDEVSEFNTLSLTIIIDSNTTLLDFEKNCIFNIFMTDSTEKINFFNFLVRVNTSSSDNIYPFSLFNEFIFSLNNYQKIKMALLEFSINDEYEVREDYDVEENLLEINDKFIDKENANDYIIFLALFALCNIRNIKIQDYLQTHENIESVFSLIESKISDAEFLIQTEDIKNSILYPQSNQPEITNALKELWNFEK